MLSDVHIEKTLLGLMMVEPSAIPTALELQPIDFSLTSHRIIFAAMRDMASVGIDINEATVISELSRLGRLESVGGRGYVLSALEGVPRGQSPLSYMRLLKRKTAVRKIAGACELAQSRIEAGDDPEEILGELSGVLPGDANGTGYRPSTKHC